MILDGDHNYFTLSEELRLIEPSAARARGLPLLILHDIGWPLARRDAYYAPERIPRRASPAAGPQRLPAPGRARARRRRDAVRLRRRARGRPAQRDPDRGRGLHRRPRPSCGFAVVPAFFGLGFIWHREAPWAGAVAELLAPWDRNPVLERLEANRIRQMTERYRITKLLDDLEPRSEASDELLRAMLDSRALALAERASGACVAADRRSAARRSGPRWASPEPAERPSSSAASSRSRARPPRSSSARLDPHPRRSTITNRFVAGLGLGAARERRLDQAQAQLGGLGRSAMRRRRAPAITPISRRRSSAGVEPAGAGARGRAAPSATSSTSSRYERRRCARPRPSRSRRRGPSFEVARREQPPVEVEDDEPVARARCRRCRRRRRRRSRRCESPRRARRAQRPQAVEAAAPISTTRRCSRACSRRGLERRRARMAAPAGERLRRPGSRDRRARRPST